VEVLSTFDLIRLTHKYKQENTHGDLRFEARWNSGGIGQVPLIYKGF